MRNLYLHSIKGGLLTLLFLFSCLAFAGLKPEQHNISNGAHGISGAPATVLYDGQLYLFCQGRDSNDELQYRVEDENGQWSLASKVEGVSMSNSPGVCVYNDKIWVFYHKSDNDGETYYTYYNGTNWSSPTKVNGISIQSSPAPVVYQNKLYLFFNDRSKDELKYKIYHNGSWGNNQLVPNSYLAYSPGPIAYQNKIYVFHHDSGEDGKLYYNAFDGNTWSGGKKIDGAKMVRSPRPVIYNNNVHIFYQYRNDSKELWCMKKYGTSSSFENMQCGNIKLSWWPSPIVHQGALRVFHQDHESKGYIRETMHTGNWNWRKDFQLAAFDMYYNGYLYKKFKDFTLPGTHNTYTAPPLFFGGNNSTDENIQFQLDQGVRMIEIDLNYSFFPYNIGLERNVGVIHGKYFGSSLFGQRSARDVLREVSDWLEANPNEVIILKIDSPSNVSYEDVKHFMTVGGLYDKLYTADHDWAEMRPLDVINAGKQVLLMGTNTGDMATNIGSQMGNSVAWGGSAPADQNPRINNKSKKLYVPAMYCTTEPLGHGSDGEAKIVNEYDFAQPYIMKGWRESARRPHVFVHDFSTYGDVMDIIWDLNTNYKSVRGKVVDSNGNQMNDVAFECSYSSDGRTVSANTNGSFNFPVKHGETVTIRPTKNGITFAQTSYTYTCSDYQNCELVISPAGINTKSALAEAKMQKESFSYVGSYPNPCENQVELVFNTRKGTDVQISCYDVTGRKIHSIQPDQVNDGINKVQWNTSSLNKGLYFIQISANGESHTRKLIKN